MLRAVVLLAIASVAAGGHPSLRPTVPSNRTVSGDVKILNGVDANPGQFPYIVSLNYQGDGHACGASIITADWILTAAHCCMTGYPMEIYVGSIYLSNGGRTYPIQEYIVNGDYDPDSHWANDICLIKLGNSLELNDNVKQVVLPPRDLVIQSGTPLTIPGWGADQNGNGPDRLQVLNNDLALNNDECSSVTGVNIINGQICALAGANKAVCSGDSGGPLSLSSSGVQVGVVSWGFVPCGTGLPDVFTRVSQYIDFITQVIGSSAKDLKFAKPEDLY